MEVNLLWLVHDTRRDSQATEVGLETHRKKCYNMQAVVIALFASVDLLVLLFLILKPAEWENRRRIQ